jgi:hypothetical protein
MTNRSLTPRRLYPSTATTDCFGFAVGRAEPNWFRSSTGCGKSAPDMDMSAHGSMVS